MSDDHDHNHTPVHTHDHGHSHGGHAHSHAPANFNRAFAVGIALNTGFVAIEAFYGWQINSLALLADAGHNLSDVAGLVLAWAGSLAVGLKPDARHTYGFKRATILAAFANALLLLLAMGGLTWEAVGRLSAPQAALQAQGGIIMAVAGIGIVVNAVTAWLFMRGGDDLNIRGAFLHMAADALVSAGVVVAGGLTLWLGWVWLDPVVSLIIAAVILWSTWSLFTQSLHLLFDGVPASVDVQQVRALLLGLPGVADVHDLHVWAMGTSHIALTAHLVTQASDTGALLRSAEEELHEHFEIRHVTLQLETPAYAAVCGLRPGLGCQSS
ncbi:cation diffusion facilitator family transporter [Rhodoferax sp.]|uniref:cation diffusion facilitator family transporter n=1 Tax=Rhodoferax sp. TaxID=50421 RepID=UPI0026351BB0|nr:cation diffusion facilitator family transporter [Rhodoferax sp.]MDD5478082.1 cation diffusion facilitator family transporter [Rhodoferax sp.]